MLKANSFCTDAIRNWWLDAVGLHVLIFRVNNRYLGVLISAQLMRLQYDPMWVRAKIRATDQKR